MSEIIRQSQKQTYGENLISKLLGELSTKEYYWEAEPEIYDNDGTSWKPDFVVVIRKLGVAIIEIKDWVEILDADRDTVTIRRRDGLQVEKKSPLRTARDYAYALQDSFERRKELLHKHKGVIKLKFPWQEFVILPNIDSEIIRELEEREVWEPGIVLGRGQISSSQKLAYALADKKWKFPLKRPLPATTVQIIRGILKPDRIILDGDGHDVGTETPLQEKLIVEPIRHTSHTQMQLFKDELLSEEAQEADQDSAVRLVRGVAGSGKSLVLIRRVKHLAEHYPDLSIAVIAFNRDLAEDLEERIGLPKVNIINFHRLCRQIISDAGQWHSPFDNNNIVGWINRFMAHEVTQSNLNVQFIAGEIAWRKDSGVFDQNSYLEINRKGRGTALSRERREVINKFFEQYTSYQKNQQRQGKSWMDWEDVPYITENILQDQHNPYRYSYDVILIDESQDFAPSWFRVIKLLLKPGGSLFMCDDPTQSLFKNFSWKEKGVDVVGHTRVLRTPFRNTREINIAAHSLVSSDPILSQSEDVPHPNFDTFELMSGPQPKLVACQNTQDEIDFVEARLIEFMNSGIRAREIAVLGHDRNILDDWNRFGFRKIYVESFRKMKGLEFQVVFIPSLHNIFQFSEVTPDEAIISEKRRAVFVAMTRARQHLFITYQGKLPDEFSPLLPYMECIKT